jgi:hypothetical protein
MKNPDDTLERHQMWSRRLGRIRPAEDFGADNKLEQRQHWQPNLEQGKHDRLTAHEQETEGFGGKTDLVRRRENAAPKPRDRTGKNLGRAQAGSRLKTERAKMKRKVLVEVMQTQTGGNLARIRQVLLVLM